jgi:proteasome lid subunit RPN8/RPN11
VLNQGKAVTGARWNHGVRDGIYDHVYSDLHHEVGGFLIGHVLDDGRVAVVGAVAALRADGHTASLTFTHDAWEDVHRELDQRFGGEAIIGWYHSHPGFGIFLSEHDLFIHRNFFDAAHQLAYVVDPHAGQEGIFAWRDGDVVPVGKGPTKRPGQRPKPVDGRPPGRGGYPLRGLALLAVLGASLGSAGWLAAGGARSAVQSPRTVTRVIAPAAPRPQPQPDTTAGESAPRDCTPPAGGSQQC